jgi:hypothetical protein
MKKTYIPTSLLICFWLICSNSILVGHSAQESSSLQFRLVQKSLIVVPVHVNGDGPFDFLLDTGTNTTLISPDLAQRLRLRPVDRVELVTVAGSEIVPRSWLNSLTLGSKTVSRTTSF